MTVWRWRTSGVPASSAFMPMVTKSAYGQLAYKDGVTATAGQQAIAAPAHDLPWDRLQPNTGQAYAEATGEQWYPQVWYQNRMPWERGVVYPAGANDAGVSVYSDNQLPVPSTDPTTGTYRYGAGKQVKAFMQPKPRAVTTRKVVRRHAY